MSGSLTDWHDASPKIFTAEELASAADLFRDRTAPYFTPTTNVPSEWVGNGRLDVVLPLPSPTIFDYHTNPAYRVPRLWVDMLQRATGKLRWEPVYPPKLTIVRYDTSAFDHHAIQTGAKAVEDALIVKAAGRSDGRILHYFGTIEDDSIMVLSRTEYYQVLVDEHMDARTRIIVEVDSEHVHDTSSSSSYGPNTRPAT